jgi:hypothetical protein
LLRVELMLYAGNNLEQGAPHLRAHYQSPAAYPADHPTAHMCVLERVALADRSAYALYPHIDVRLPTFHNEPELLGGPCWQDTDMRDGAHRVRHHRLIACCAPASSASSLQAEARSLA